MEDIITLVIAIAIGLASMLAGQRNKTKTKAPKQSTEELDHIPSEVLERELDAQTTGSAKASQPSTLDILGRILSGDFSDLVGQPKPKPHVPDNEYVDPMLASRRRQAKRNADQKEQRQLEELKFAQQARKPSPTSETLHNPATLRQAIIVSELLDKPVSLRRRKKVG